MGYWKWFRKTLTKTILKAIRNRLFAYFMVSTGVLFSVIALTRSRLVMLIGIVVWLVSWVLVWSYEYYKEVVENAD